MATRRRYNPRTGTYARGAVAYGPYGAVGAAQTYNPRTRAFRQTSAGSRDRSTNVRTLFARNNRARCDFVGEQHEEVSCP